MARFPLRLKLLAALVALLALWASARAAESDKGVLADLISRALSSPSMSVSIGAVDGVLSSDASISDIVLSDRQGPWLRIDKVRLVWNRLALFSRRLEVDQLTIGRMQFLRRPLPAETPPPDNGGPRSILPELPVKVIVKQFAVQELSLSEPVVGVAARLDISGKATLGPPSEGLDLTLTSQRLDAPGDFKALLTYVPAADQLTLNVNSAEPAGGLFAHLANLPGLPPVKLAFNGAGQLDNFTAKLDFAAGADVWANGQVVVARQGAGRRLTLDLNSRLEGLAPGVIRPVFAGETTLKGDVLFNDDSSIALPGGLHLVSASARLDFEGGKSANDLLDLKLHAGAIPGSAAIGKLDLNASINGPLSSPTIDGAFDAGQIHVAEGSVDRVEASFRASPNGPLSDEATRILFEGQATVNGLALADPAFSQAVGRELSLTMRGSASSSGEATFDALDLTAPNFEAHYSGLLARSKIHGKATIAVRDLSRFALLAGGTLKGEARIAADLDGAPRYGALSATVDAHATKLATGYPILDRVTGGTLALTGAARLTPGGGFGFTDLVASGQHGSARLNGEYGPDKVDLGARIEVPEAQVLDPRVTGKAEIAGALSGAPSDLTAALKATLSEGRLLDRKTSGVTFEALANHITGLVEANASVSGDVDGHALQGSAHVEKRNDGGWVVDNLGLNLASARLAGALTIGADQPGDRRTEFQRDGSRRSVAARSDEVERRPRGEGERFDRRRQAVRLHCGDERQDDHRRQSTRGSQGRSQGRRRLGREDRLRLRATRQSRNCRAVDHRRQAHGCRQPLGERSRFQRDGARPRADGARAAHRGAAHSPGACDLCRPRRRPSDHARGARDLDLRKRRSRHQESRVPCRRRPPIALGPCRVHPRPSGERGRPAAGGARFGLAGPRLVGRR